MWRTPLSSQFASKPGELAGRLAPRHAYNNPAPRRARRFHQEHCSGGRIARSPDGCAIGRADVGAHRDDAPLRRNAARAHVKPAEPAENSTPTRTSERTGRIRFYRCAPFSPYSAEYAHPYFPRRLLHDAVRYVPGALADHRATRPPHFLDGRRPRSLPGEPVEPSDGLATCAVYSRCSLRRCHVHAKPADPTILLAELTVYLVVFATRTDSRCIYCKWAHCAAASGAVRAARICCVRCGPACSALVGRSSSISSVDVCGAARFACVRCGSARSAYIDCISPTRSSCRRSTSCGSARSAPASRVRSNSLKSERNPPCQFNLSSPPERNLPRSPPDWDDKDANTLLKLSSRALFTEASGSKIRGFVSDLKLYLQMCARPVHYWGNFLLASLATEKVEKIRRSHVAESVADYATFKKGVETLFRKFEFKTSYRAMLRTHAQAGTESVAAYAARTMNVCSKAYAGFSTETQLSLAVDHFIAGLAEDIARVPTA